MTSRHPISYWFRFGDDSFLVITFLRPLRHVFGAALRAEKSDIKQIQKMIPYITCGVSFSQDVCELIPRVDVPDLDLIVKFDSVKQPVKCISVGPGDTSLCRTSANNDHLDHNFIVSKMFDIAPS